ncbi:ATP-binding cassette domain-containing protein [endosymbiont GvMRE of Glomus versiforme]|uniref:ATP-binding cassette domain-containing protein n=1 Tax=endosymbiont GvMRE of Glomus versiforme TaxID=2039283 RepID=UPI000ED6BC98|nr:ABC transporter ATP-binding protein/permease [endosymbiont GvMRE of Glomus versiforme]RHZ37115.1 ABC transporter, ATP-binding protein [endosymbiont GvMRE of Glomus versiforme]
MLAWWPILLTINNVIFLKIDKLREENANYAVLLPEFLQKFITKLNSKEWFLLALSWLTFSFFIEYLLGLWEEELKIRGSNYVESKLLNKFRRLTFEEKSSRGKELSVLIEVDAQMVGNNWEFLVRDTFTAITLVILYFISIYVGLISFIFLGWMILIGVISYLFGRAIANNEKKYKEKRTKYSLLINEEVNKGNLIEGMGLNSHYEKQENHLRKKNEKLKLSFNRIFSLRNNLPFRLMIAFPLLIVSILTGLNLVLFWSIGYWFSRITANCLTYGNYSASVQRINNFLQLPEKNDNLEKLKLTNEIESISFKNVGFKYKSSQNWVLQNYNETFETKKINRLSGGNGKGKSTIIYLILGLIEPNDGEAIITDIKGKTYNLYQDINLRHWRENNVAYASHDNLIEGASTGQKQLANINNVLKTKKNAAIFLFDEADNALDREKQIKFYQKLEELTKNKLIIYVKHETNEKIKWT